MNRSVYVEITVVFFVILYFVVVYMGSGISVYSNNNRNTRPRLLPKPDKDPLHAGTEVLQSLIQMLGNVRRYTFSGTSSTQSKLASQVLMHDFAVRHPLHVFVDTKVKLSPDSSSSSIERTVKKLYRFNEPSK